MSVYAALLSHYFRVAYSWPLCANVTPSIKPEVHNESQRCQRMTEQLKSERSVPEICSRTETDRQTDRQTNIQTCLPNRKPRSRSVSKSRAWSVNVKAEVMVNVNVHNVQHTLCLKLQKNVNFRLAHIIDNTAVIRSLTV